MSGELTRDFSRSRSTILSPASFIPHSTSPAPLVLTSIVEQRSTLMASHAGDHTDTLSATPSGVSSLHLPGLAGSVSANRGEDIPPSHLLSLSVLSITDASSSASSSKSGPLSSSARPCAAILPSKSGAFVEGGGAMWRRKLESKVLCDKISKGEEENHAIEEAGTRALQEQIKQNTISDLPRFELPEKATRDELIEFLKKRFARYKDLKSFDICGMAVVTPPTDIVTYHIVDITRSSGDNSESSKSVLQLLARETDNYIIGFRRTPGGTGTDKDGFFLFADVIIPEFFGESHKLRCGSSYRLLGRIQIFKNVMTLMVESLLRVNVDTYKDIKRDTRQMMETWMLILGECERMNAPLDFVMKNYTHDSRTNLSHEVILYMHNWSHLSSAILEFYLGILEVTMGVDGSKETYFNGRKSMAVVVKKFTDRGYKLDLTDAKGFLSLKKLAQNCVPLLKYDETKVKNLIMARQQIYKAQFQHIKHPRNDEEDKKIDEECIRAEQMEELQFFERDGDNLIMKLLEQYDEEKVGDPSKRSYLGKVG